MTVVNFKTIPANKVFNNLMDNFFQPSPSMFRAGTQVANHQSSVAVNITEKEDSYLLQLVAPGLQKEDFSINLEKDLLTVSAEAKKEEGKEGREIKKEYVFQSFKRSFTIDQKIDTEKISAEYVNGVLTLNLAKKAEVKPETKQINVL